MKKYYFVFLIIFLLPQTKLFSQHLELGFEVPLVINDSHVRSGNGVNFSFEYRLPSILSFKGGLGGVSALTNGAQLAPGSYSFFWAEASAQIRESHGWIQPYAGVGIGFYKTDINLATGNRFRTDRNGLREKDNIQYKIGYNLRGGLDLPLSSILILNTEVKYVIFNPDVLHTYKSIQTLNTFTVDNHVNLDTYFVQFGLEVLI